MPKVSMLMLSLVGLLALTSPVMANLGQEIVQTSSEQVGSSADVDYGVSVFYLPYLDYVPGGEELIYDLDDYFEAVPDTTAPPVSGTTFQSTRLGQALQSTSGVEEVEVASKFVIAFWHQLVLDLQLADYSRVDASGNIISAPENPGPCYASRAMAMAHLAMYDAFVGVTGDAATYLSYSSEELPSVSMGELQSIAAAAAAGNAVSQVLFELYQNPDDRAAIERSRTSFEEGLTAQFDIFIPFLSPADPWPQTVARKIIADRSNDGAGNPDDLAFVAASSVNGGSTATYAHVPDPTAVDPESGEEQFLYAPHWGSVRPFLHSSSSLPGLQDFGIESIVEGPLALYRQEFLEVLNIGRNDADVTEPRMRSLDQTQIGLWWAYDGGFRIGVPPRLYNSITDDILIELFNTGDPSLATGFQLVRLYAMVNVALADAGIAAWRDKYFYNFWRPIIGIRRANEDPATADLQDEEWVQLGAPNTNRNRPGVNPAFPAYPSGHATFGTSVLRVVKGALQLPDSRRFELFSDEFNGKAVDDNYCAKFGDCVTDSDNPIEPEAANKRPFITRLLTIEQAIEENKEGRIYLGVHWRDDQEAGTALGDVIANNVMFNFPNRV